MVEYKKHPEVSDDPDGIRLGKAQVNVMDNETMSNDYYSDGEQKPKSPVGKIIKWVGLALVVLVYGLIFFRIFIKENPSDAGAFIWTKDTVAAYQKDSAGFSVKSQKIQSYNKVLGKDDNGAPIAQRVIYNDITSDGCFKISDLIYVPASGELQVTLRFNREALKKLKERYALSEDPTGEIFFFALEGVGEDYITDYSYTVSKRFTYEYRRLVFRNVDLSSADLVYLNIYYIEDVHLDQPLTFHPGKEYAVQATLPIYDSYLGWEDCNVEKLLPAKVNDDLQNPPYVKLDD